MKPDFSWFDPLPKQKAFLESYEKETVYAGGFGSGKTLCGCFKVVALLMLNPGTAALVCRQSYMSLNDTTKKVMLDGDGDKPPVLPPELIERRMEGPSDNRVILVNGSEIMFRSIQDFNPAKIRSINAGVVYVDELTETSEKLWDELLGRLRHPKGPGLAFGTTNPNGHDWVWRRFHPDSPRCRKDTRLLLAKTDENHYLPPDYIAHLRNQPIEWQRRFLDCSFEVAAGLIWRSYDREIHVVPDQKLPYDWHRFEAFDYGMRNPAAFLSFAVDKDGNIWVEDGYKSSADTVEQHIEALKQMRTRVGRSEWPAIVTGGDTWKRNPITGRTMADEMREIGQRMGVKLAFLVANDDVKQGLLRVSEWLQRDPQFNFPMAHPFGGTAGPDEQGAPRLFILDNEGTLGLREEITDYRYEDLSPQVAMKRDEEEKPRKINDHAVDALRYGIMSRPRPTTQRSVLDYLQDPSPIAAVVDRQF